MVGFRFDCSAIRASFVDTVSKLNVSPVVPLSRVSCPASPSLQWVPWASVPHLPVTAHFQQHRYYAPLRLPLPFPVGSLVAPFRYLSNMPLVCFPRSSQLRIADRWTWCLSPPGLLISRYPLSSGNLHERRQEVLPSSRITPLNTCHFLRLRWCPFCIAIAQQGLLPSGRSTPSAFAAQHGLS